MPSNEPPQPQPAPLEPVHRTRPRASLPLPFPAAQFDASPIPVPCTRCGASQNGGSRSGEPDADHDADRINARWARHVAEISHELRTPLAGITGFAALLEGPDLTEEQHQLVNRINECSKTMLDLVNDVLDEAMAQSGDVRIADRPFSPARLARDCTSLVAAANEGAAVSIGCHIGSGVPNTARGDRQRIGQILVNLIANAAAASDQGAVELVVRHRGSRNSPKLLWSILDNGSGLSTEERSRLFLPFERGAGRTAKGGKGLGLSISQKLAEKMGGRITVRSTIGRGSIFTFHQPLARPAPAKVPISGLSSLHLPRILLVQRSQSQRMISEAVLQAFGFQFDCIDTPGQFITALRSTEHSARPYIAALVDVDDDADAALHVIRTIRSAGLSQTVLPVYALSGAASPGLKDGCLEAGFQDMLPKPFTHEAFAGLARVLITPALAEPGRQPRGLAGYTDPGRNRSATG
ncbi:ATP-binding protein [Pontixanthobacter sp.]|uniref:ATP-binding response regulator n=1 Tax=Pontixanthobacter sp. TaxID=2792078 RepID=UPI003C7A2E02